MIVVDAAASPGRGVGGRRWRVAEEEGGGIEAAVARSQGGCHTWRMGCSIISGLNALYNVVTGSSNVWIAASASSARSMKVALPSSTSSWSSSSLRRRARQASRCPHLRRKSGRTRRHHIGGADEV
ncbi:hypothetical protein PAHAL_9G160800 [Panicum hallii]|uniref:Uncharacterized protein n=1 Tax=Panicum hallii TaxID=206008 RepID=A0A2S3IK06_9POAL|nr:hypothetical protein PAHAL_9G160800 [Panicum hallii]